MTDYPLPACFHIYKNNENSETLPSAYFYCDRYNEAQNYDCDKTQPQYAAGYDWNWNQGEGRPTTEFGELNRFTNDGKQRMNPRKSGALETEDLESPEAEGYYAWKIRNHQQPQMLLVPRKEPRQQTTRQPILGKRGLDDSSEDVERDEATNEVFHTTKRYHRTVGTPNLMVMSRRSLNRPRKQAGQKEPNIIRQRIRYQYGN